MYIVSNFSLCSRNYVIAAGQNYFSDSIVFPWYNNKYIQFLAFNEKEI